MRIYNVVLQMSHDLLYQIVELCYNNFFLQLLMFCFLQYVKSRNHFRMLFQLESFATRP